VQRAVSPATETVRGLEYRFSIPSYGKTLLLQKLGWRRLALTGAPLVLVERPRPPLPAPDWLRVAVRLAGVCGSDLGMLKATLSPVLSPFASFPAVMGHEGLGVIDEVGARLTLPVGARVVWDPFLGCHVRGLDPCPACARGVPALCSRTTEGRFAPAMILGTCRDLPGTWSEEVLLHESQVHLVPDAIPDDTAVLVEPLSVAAHAVLATPPAPGETVLVIGAGTIGLLTVAAIRLFDHTNRVVVLARHRRQGELAKALGADLVLSDREGVEGLAGALGLGLLKALDGKPVLADGVGLVFDAVGNPEGLRLALASAARGGRVNLVGSPGILARLDVTPVWTHEIRLTGSLGYGREEGMGGRHTFDLVLERLAERPDLPLPDLITHRLPLSHVREALALLAEPRTAVGKLLFVPEKEASRG
jgi:threonine dehydrogenase-like Zn-dependent dehydrogenase